LAAKLHRPGGPPPPHQRLVSLTPTETAVVDLLAQGLTNPQIAEGLFISRATMKTHLIHVQLGVGTRSQLAADATRHYTAPR
jgi:DNA-binding NarL/FixJ family response regulator